MNEIHMSVFMVTWFVGFGSWFYLLAEMIGMWRFWPWAYRHGFKLYEAPAPSLVRRPFPHAIELPDVKARAVSPDEILFRAPAPLFGFRVHTPFPIKANIQWTESTVRVVGKIPVGSVVFLGAWLLGWSTAGLLPAKENFNPASFVLGGWAIVGIMVAMSLPLELHRIRKATAALVAYLQGAAQQQVQGPTSPPSAGPRP